MVNWIISSSCLILIVFIVRRLFTGKISFRLQYALWILVAVRLLIPVNLGSSAISIENFINRVSAQRQITEAIENEVPEMSNQHHTEEIKIDDSVDRVRNEETGNVKESEQLNKPMELTSQMDSFRAEDAKMISSTEILMGIWIAGIIIFGCICLISNFIFDSKLKRSRSPLENSYGKLQVYQSAVVDTPCLFGLFRPAIYVTPNVAKDSRILKHAVCHEQSHYQQGDLFWALIRCICLLLHWYNPLVWWAVKFSKQDAELACDEATIRKLGEEERLSYGKTLIQLTCEKQSEFFLTATTMTTGKRNIKERIERIAKAPNLKMYAFLGVVLVAAIAAGCTFTGAKNVEEIPLAPVRGTPCEGPETSGWNLSLAEDVTEKFQTMSPEPEEGTADSVYILGETSRHGYLLYGKGDYQTMLLCMDHKYAEIDFPYASDYMNLPQLIEKDIDRDGEMELCIILHLQHGSGLHIENLLLADFNEEGQLYVYEFVPEIYTEQLQEGLTCEISEEGIQPVVDGQPAGRMAAHPEDIGLFEGVSVGNDMRFDCDPLTGEVRLRGGIMLLNEEHPGGLYGNANDVSAKVCWDGERFSLKNFTSNSWWLEEQITYALQKQYGAESFYSIKMNYDSTKMNEDTLVVSVDILPEKTDSVENRAKVHLKKSEEITSEVGWENLSAYSGWEIDIIYSDAVFEVEQIIDDENGNSSSDVQNTSGQMIIKNRSYETVVQDEIYRHAINTFLETGVFPTTAGVQCNGDPFSALYAVQDIDMDGKEELLLSFPNAETIAGMIYYIYDYDRTTGMLYVQNSGYPNFTIYDNGYIKQEMSHNHGRSNLDDFWPYWLYFYDQEADFYEVITSVDAWQEREDGGQDPHFPKDKDLDGDGVVYYDDMAQTYDAPENIMDNEEYEKWCERYDQGNAIEIQWYLAGGKEPILTCSFGDDISVKNHEILSEYVFSWISWEDVLNVIGNDYEEWISEEGANGRMIYRTFNGVTYILPENFEGAEVDQIAGVLIKDEKYQLSCGLSVGMKESEIVNVDMPFRRYEKDVNGRGLYSENGEISLYVGMDNPQIIEYDYAYSWDEGFVLDVQEQKERLQELEMPEKLSSEVHFIPVVFVKNEVVAGIFMGIIP